MRVIWPIDNLGIRGDRTGSDFVFDQYKELGFKFDWTLVVYWQFRNPIGLGHHEKVNAASLLRLNP